MRAARNQNRLPREANSYDRPKALPSTPYPHQPTHRRHSDGAPAAGATSHSSQHAPRRTQRCSMLRCELPAGGWAASRRQQPSHFEARMAAWSSTGRAVAWRWALTSRARPAWFNSHPRCRDDPKDSRLRFGSPLPNAPPQSIILPPHLIFDFPRPKLRPQPIVRVRGTRAKHKATRPFWPCSAARGLNHSIDSAMAGEAPQTVFSRWARVPADGAPPTKRCGHTFTAVSGEGTRRLILFGGATALESSGSSTGGASGIRAHPPTDAASLLSGPACFAENFPPVQAWPVQPARFTPST